MAADVVTAKALYEARVKEIYCRRDHLRVMLAGKPEKKQAIQAWVDCAEEMAATAYDVVRFDVQALGAMRPEVKAHCESESKRMADRHAVLSAELPELEAAIA